VDDPAFASAEALAGALRRKAISARELVEWTLAAVARVNPTLNAFLSMAGDALEAAAEADTALARGDPRPLLGVPVAVKDMERTRGLRTTFGSLVYRDFVPQADSVIVERLRAAGAIVIGKTNTPEFALLGETANRLGPDCVNPWDPARTAGGSSGGSAAAVAAGVVALATGTDTAGSITIPSGFCGTFGLKPTRRRIPVWPVPEEWPLFLANGPIARTVRDAALLLAATAGPDRRDPLCLKAPPPDFLAALGEPPPRLRIACAPALAGAPVDDAPAAIVEEVAATFSGLGHRVSAAAPELARAADIVETIGDADEFAIRGELLERHAERLHPETRAVLERGRETRAASYARALYRLLEVRGAFESLFAEHDLLLAPATACVAFPCGQPPDRLGGRPVTPGWTTFAPLNMYANLTGGPVACLPAGAGPGDLPLGALAFARPGEEALLLAACAAFEAARPWNRRPPVAA